MRDDMSKDAKKAMEEIKQSVRLLQEIFAEVGDILKIKEFSEESAKKMQLISEQLGLVTERVNQTDLILENKFTNLTEMINELVNEIRTSREKTISLMDKNQETQVKTNELIDRLFQLIELSISRDAELSKNINQLTEAINQIKAEIQAISRRVEEIEKTFSVLSTQKEPKDDLSHELGITF